MTTYCFRFVSGDEDPLCSLGWSSFHQAQARKTVQRRRVHTDPCVVQRRSQLHHFLRQEEELCKKVKVCSASHWGYDSSAYSPTQSCGLSLNLFKIWEWFLSVSCTVLKHGFVDAEYQCQRVGQACKSGLRFRSAGGKAWVSESFLHSPWRMNASWH